MSFAAFMGQRAAAAEERVRELEEQVARLVAGQRSVSEARQQAFLELAQDLAEMDPAQRDATIRRIITQHEEGR